MTNARTASTSASPEIRVEEAPAAGLAPGRKRMGIGLVTENRKEQGIFASTFRSSRTSPWPPRAVREQRRHLPQARKRGRGGHRREMSIKTPTLQQTINKLSGGNQQKAHSRGG